jgi:hypothetical protein
MTKENAIAAATKIAKSKNITMAVVKDTIVNNAESDPTGPWGYCPDDSKDYHGKFILYPWAEEVIIIGL